MFSLFVLFTASRPGTTKPPSQKPERQQLIDTSVEVTRLRSKSKGGSDLDSGSYHGENPMEQPQFGAPSDKSYYVSSSHFTSRDVEEFKRISSQKFSKTRSECSSSSHISCPDPPQMNLSPAEYVGKPYQGSLSSDHSSEFLDQKDKGSCISREFSGRFEQDRTSDLKAVNADSEIFTTDYDTPIPDSDVKTKKTTDMDNKDDDEIAAVEKKSELEESWEEFYKSPLKKDFSDMSHRKVRRLESINQEIREEAILKGFEEMEAKIDATIPAEMVESSQTVVADVEGDNATNDQAAEEVTFNVGPNLEDLIDNCDTEDATSIKTLGDKMSAGTNELLDMSQKLLNELGIEENIDNVEEEDNDIKVEDVYGEVKKPMHIEEKVNVETDDECADVVITNQKKKKKVRQSDSIEKLKPFLSLSPPKPRGSDPELSSAVADKVVQIRPTESPDFLKKQRLSLPGIGLAKTKGNSKKRQSVPDVYGEGRVKQDSGDSNNTQDCSEEDLTAVSSQSVSPLDNKGSGEYIQGRQSRTRSGESIGTDEDETFHRYETLDWN